MKLLPALGLHMIKPLPIKIIDNSGRKKNTKLLPIEFICTSHNSVLRLSNTIGTIVLDDPKSKQRGVEYIFFQN